MASIHSSNRPPEHLPCPSSFPESQKSGVSLSYPMVIVKKGSDGEGGGRGREGGGAKITKDMRVAKTAASIPPLRSFRFSTLFQDSGPRCRFK